MGLFVTERTARLDMPRVLEALEAVSPQSVATKQAALREARAAFGFWRNSTPHAPSATDYIFHELCALARAWKQNASRAASRTWRIAEPAVDCLLV